MKRLIITLLAAVCLNVSAHAQEKREMKKGHQPHKHHHGMMMAKQLNFSEDQQKQAKAFNEDFKKKMQELNKNESITVKEQRDRKEALRKEHKAKMDGLLTADQKTRLAQLKTERKAEADRRFATHLDKMKTNLALSDAQLVQLKAQREVMHNKMKALKENDKLTREQRQDQMMALRAEAKEQRKKIFTADQLKKMEEMKKNRMDNHPVK